MSYRVFISHSAKDNAFARLLARQLGQTGAEAVTPLELNAGADVRRKTDEMLRRSDEVLVLLSENSLTSDWIGYEVGLALGLHKKLVPMTMGIEPNDLPAPLNSMQSVGFDHLDRYLRELSERVQSHAERSTKPALAR